MIFVFFFTTAMFHIVESNILIREVPRWKLQSIGVKERRY